MSWNMKYLFLLFGSILGQASLWDKPAYGTFKVLETLEKTT